MKLFNLKGLDSAIISETKLSFFLAKFFQKFDVDNHLKLSRAGENKLFKEQIFLELKWSI
jgi:hypothetical protein